jgi:hypothetical protein
VGENFVGGFSERGWNIKWKKMERKFSRGSTRWNIMGGDAGNFNFWNFLIFYNFPDFLNKKLEIK